MRRPGFLLVEALIGIAIFATLVVAAYGVLLNGQSASIRGGDRVRATAIANQALQAAKSMRASSFAGLTAGTHGIAIGSNGQWTWSGSQITHSGSYITSVGVTSLATDWLRLTATTRWNHGKNGSGSVVLTADLTDWQASLGGNWASVSLEGSYVDAGTPLFNDVVVSGNYAFVSSETSGGGAGLYVFDISNLTSPSRVASAFSLGGPGYQMALSGTGLYIAVGSAGDEIRVYDVSSPASFSAGNLLATYNLPGSARARSLEIKDTTLFVGAAESATSGENEFYAFSIASASSITLQSSLNDTTSIMDISLRGTGAYLAGSQDTSEIRVANIGNPASMAFLGGYNLTDVYDGLSVVAFGTGTLLGRTNGSAISELTRFTVGTSAVPSSPPGPWYREMGGNVNAADIEASECAGFFATSNGTKELQVVNVRGTALTEFTFYNTTTGDGRGIRYDATLDRVFMVTNKALLIIKPASGTLSCT
jgi:type II secretory pathway pseudopilin PulG